MNSAFQRFNYWSRYGRSPLSSYFAVEYKNLEDAEAALLSVLERDKVRRGFYKLVDLLEDAWYSLALFLTRDREKERMEEYFSRAIDHADLEQRMKNWERMKNQNRFYI